MDEPTQTPSSKNGDLGPPPGFDGLTLSGDMRMSVKRLFRLMDQRYPNNTATQAVCHHWARGHCWEGIKCGFLHPIYAAFGFEDSQIFFHLVDDPGFLHCIPVIVDFSSDESSISALTDYDNRFKEGEYRPICRHWLKQGKCGFDDDCNFLHPRSSHPIRSVSKQPEPEIPQIGSDDETKVQQSLQLPRDASQPAEGIEEEKITEPEVDLTQAWTALLPDREEVNKNKATALAPPTTHTFDKVLVLDCGGTICCTKNIKTGKSAPNKEIVDAKLKEFNQKDKVDYQPCICVDSSHITEKEWEKIIMFCTDAIGRYRGIVITHGTDTLAYSAALLTFTFPLLTIPIVLTAAQMSLEDQCTDATSNLLGAIMVASHEECPFIPEVLVFFGHNILLGSRIQKVDATDMNAFISTSPRLGTFNGRFQVDTVAISKLTRKRLLHHIRHNKCNGAFVGPLPPKDQLSHEQSEKYLRLCTTEVISPLKVAVVQLFPGIQTTLLQAIIETGAYQGIVIEAFGSGNGPAWLNDFFRQYSTIYFAICSTCQKGFVSLDYEAGLGTEKGVKFHNVALCEDMTTECTLLKLACTAAMCEAEIAKLPPSPESERPKKIRFLKRCWQILMENPIRGEMTLKSTHH